MMAFDSLQAFWAMEGHGPYVWVCYGVFFLLITGLGWWSLREHRQVIRRQRRALSMDGEAATDSRKEQAATPASFQRIHPS